MSVVEMTEDVKNHLYGNKSDLAVIAERLGVSNELDEILNEIGVLETSVETQKKKLDLFESDIAAHVSNFRVIADHLGVLSKVADIIQCIDKIRADEKEAYGLGFDYGLSAAKEMQELEYEKNELLAKQAELKKQQDDLEQRSQKLGEQIKNRRKE